MILVRVRHAQHYVVTNRIIQGLKGSYRTADLSYTVYC